jgi:sugar phosphate isomerase/epimerase
MQKIASLYIGAAAALLGALLLHALDDAPHAVRIGYCGPLKDIDAAKSAGFDYMEIRTSEVAALSEPDYEQLVAKLSRLALPVPAAYWLLPAEVKVTGPGIDIERQTSYLSKALDRISRLGVRVVVFGSSGARQVPDGFSKQLALQQLIDFGKRAGPLAQSRNITIAIEPQRREESNIINTTAEALAWVEAVNHPNVQLMIDYYHFEVEKEDPAVIPQLRKHLRHLHMANPNNRVMPLNLDEYNYAPFFAVLRKIQYDGLIGLEASSTNLQEDGPKSIALLRRALAR